jgi:hypothetical protein
MKLFLPLVFSVLSYAGFSQTVGWFYSNPGNTDGYVLFAPGNSDTTFLIDKCGKRIHEWGSKYNPGLAVYLLDDGTLLRCGNTENSQFNGGGHGGIVEILDWEGTVLWSYLISDNLQCQHHDAIRLPNGNIVALVWEYHTKAEAEAAGRVNVGSKMWSEKVIEIEPIGTDSGVIVWEWRAWDHLVQDADSTKLNYGVVKDHPELLDINIGNLDNFNVDWLHFNSLNYNEERDQLMISCHNLSEIYILDHSTTTAEAASHTGGISGQGGDLLYRWGNPKNYDRGTTTDRKLFQQHNAYWIPQGYPAAGSVMFFNNGVDRPGSDYTTVETFSIPDMIGNNYPLEADSAYDPDNSDWIYSANPPTSMFSFVQGGAQRLLNGNTLICDATSGRFIEVDSVGNNLWKYINPIDVNGNTPQGDQPFMNSCFRVTYLPFDHPGLAGQTLLPGTPLELDPLPYVCENIPTVLADVQVSETDIAAFPNPFHNQFTIQLPHELQSATLQIHDLMGRLLYEERHLTSVSENTRTVTLPDFKGLVIISVKNEDDGKIWQVTAIGL